MKKLIIFFVLCTSTQLFASNGFVLLCKNADGDIVSMTDTHSSYCVSEVVWGRDSVCYEGNPEGLANYLNSGALDNRSRGYLVSDAEVTNTDTVIYTGYDQQNFYSKDSEIAACDPDFYNN